MTEGLDGLRDRLREYFRMRARFAKWRAVIALDDHRPSRGCIEANAHALARYAALCQEAVLVPVVEEPEVLMDGDHTLQRCREVTAECLRTVFDQLHVQRVLLEGLILKPNMVLPGLTCPQESANEIALATVKYLLEVVPAAVPGIAFLSGGQSGKLASARLNAMHGRSDSTPSPLPWALTFSFGRAIQQPALGIWSGEAAHRGAAQAALLHRARCNRAAGRGEYSGQTERT
jgi:fructose-bisphosphate aldolase class I